jgi:hypothetical protein
MDDALITLRIQNLADDGLPVGTRRTLQAMGFRLNGWYSIRSALFTDSRIRWCSLRRPIPSYVLFLLALVSNWVIRSGYTLARALFLVFSCSGIRNQPAHQFRDGNDFFSVLVFVLMPGLEQELLSDSCYGPRAVEAEAGWLYSPSGIDFIRAELKEHARAAALGILWPVTTSSWCGFTAIVPILCQQASGPLFRWPH